MKKKQSPKNRLITKLQNIGIDALLLLKGAFTQPKQTLLEINANDSSLTRYGLAAIALWLIHILVSHALTALFHLNFYAGFGGNELTVFGRVLAVLAIPGMLLGSWVAAAMILFIFNRTIRFKTVIYNSFIFMIIISYLYFLLYPLYLLKNISIIYAISLPLCLIQVVLWLTMVFILSEVKKHSGCLRLLLGGIMCIFIGVIALGWVIVKTVESKEGIVHVKKYEWKNYIKEYTVSYELTQIRKSAKKNTITYSFRKKQIPTNILIIEIAPAQTIANVKTAGNTHFTYHGRKYSAQLNTISMGAIIKNAQTNNLCIVYPDGNKV